MKRLQELCHKLEGLGRSVRINKNRFKSYRQIVGISMGTNCAPLVTDLLLFCYERDFLLSRSEDTQSDVIEALGFFCSRISVLQFL